MKTYLMDFCDNKETTPRKNIHIKGTVLHEFGSGHA